MRRAIPVTIALLKKDRTPAEQPAPGDDAGDGKTGDGVEKGFHHGIEWGLWKVPRPPWNAQRRAAIMASRQAVRPCQLKIALT